MGRNQFDDLAPEDKAGITWGERFMFRPSTEREDALDQVDETVTAEVAAERPPHRPLSSLPPAARRLVGC